MSKTSSSDPRILSGARAGLIGALGMAAGVILGGCAPAARGIPDVPTAPVPAAAPEPEPEPAAEAAPIAPAALSPAQIAARATPAVVAIRGPRSMGTGFIVRREGWIATNLHVIVRQPSLAVAIPGREELPVVEVVAVDPAHDLAVVRVEAEDLPVVRLGNSGAVRAGDAIVAIGHPLGLEDTVSNGLVSAVREVSDALTVFQISAPIAPGSSGGPLFDEGGRVIGIATATVNKGQNINFGVPVSYLKAALMRPEPIRFEAFVEAQRGPRVEREVPRHDVAILEGCGEGDLMLLRYLLLRAVREGAEPYGRGDHAMTSQLLEGASVDAERRLGPTCKGPRRVLEEARAGARRLEDGKARVWALRDGVDGVIEVVGRRLEAGPG